MKMKLRSDKKERNRLRKKGKDCIVRRRRLHVFCPAAFPFCFPDGGRRFCIRHAQNREELQPNLWFYRAFYRFLPKKCLTERGTMIYLSRHVICVCEQSIHANITLTTRLRGSRPYGQPGQLPSGGQRAAIIDCVRSAIL